MSKVVTHGSLRIGFTHGHTVVPPGDAEALLIAARQMDVDVLLWGGTHRFEAYEMEGKFFVNPGSGTGAFATGWGWENDDEKPTPSFCLMDVSDSRIERSATSDGTLIADILSRDCSTHYRFKETCLFFTSTN